MNNQNLLYSTTLFIICGIMAGCVPPGEIQRPELPSLAYARQMHTQRFEEEAPTAVKMHRANHVESAINNNVENIPQAQNAYSKDAKASYQFVKDLPPELRQPKSDIVTNMPEHGALSSGMEPAPSYETYRTSNTNVRPYQGPLALGQIGVSTSLWRQASQGAMLYRDHRAFQPMDLLTIIVQENAEGTKEADTETTKESSLLMGIANFFNFELDAESKNPGLDTTTLVDADVETEYTGEGETTRRGSLTARIAAIVVEVFPNGIMRIEGERIISVNNEEQIMVISGLVRPRDLNSLNEVQSSNIANLRIDYFGKGIIGEVQYAGWAGRLISRIWPF